MDKCTYEDGILIPNCTGVAVHGSLDYCTCDSYSPRKSHIHEFNELRKRIDAIELKYTELLNEIKKQSR